MTTPWSATTPDGRACRLPERSESGVSHTPLTDAEYERAWRGLYLSGVSRLTSGELRAEIEHLQQERALLLGDLRAREFPDDPEEVVRNTVAYIDAQLVELDRQARRFLRAVNLPRRGNMPPLDFARARYADLVGLAESITGRSARKTGQGRYVLICPFHEDRHPSLVIYPPGRGWWCPVCHRGGGDAVSFVAAVQGSTQAAALRFVELVCDLPAAS